MSHPVAAASSGTIFSKNLASPKLQICERRKRRRGSGVVGLTATSSAAAAAASYRWLACTALACEISDPREPNLIERAEREGRF